MTNRQYIKNKPASELLHMMNDCIRYKSDNDFCIMDCLHQYDTIRCITRNEGDMVHPVTVCDCDKCIQSFLDEES